jgi:hypothetical protein
MGGTLSGRRNLLPPKVPRSVHGMSGDRSLHTKVPVAARAVGRDFDFTSGRRAKPERASVDPPHYSQSPGAGHCYPSAVLFTLRQCYHSGGGLGWRSDWAHVCCGDSLQAGSLHMRWCCTASSPPWPLPILRSMALEMRRRGSYSAPVMPAARCQRPAEFRQAHKTVMLTARLLGVPALYLSSRLIQPPPALSSS